MQTNSLKIFNTQAILACNNQNFVHPPLKRNLNCPIMKRNLNCPIMKRNLNCPIMESNTNYFITALLPEYHSSWNATWISFIRRGLQQKESMPVYRTACSLLKKLFGLCCFLHQCAVMALLGQPEWLCSASRNGSVQPAETALLSQPECPAWPAETACIVISYYMPFRST
jgi:hypothetical protein